MTLKSRFMKVAPPALIRAARGIRTTSYRMLAPFEQVLGIANDRNPPRYLKRFIGDPRNFRQGEAFASFLVGLGLKSSDSVVDIGCGCGSIAIPLSQFMGSSSRYLGLDIYAPAIDWCARHVTPRHPHFRFVHLDVSNPIYTSGGASASRARLPLDESSVDLVFLRSVFTHMNPSEIGAYLLDIGRALRPGGRCVATFFLLGPEQERLASEGRCSIPFAFGSNGWRYQYESSPYTACAQDEESIRRMADEARLLTTSVLYGRWSGRSERTAPELQDCVIFTKPSGTPISSEAP
jgi:SAM-dependent methyltransferase